MVNEWVISDTACVVSDLKSEIGMHSTWHTFSLSFQYVLHVVILK